MALGNDDLFYSRQRYVIGEEANRKLNGCRVYLAGIKGLGVEIVKNLLLLGVGEVVIEDNENVSEKDLGHNLVVNKDDVHEKRNCAEVCHEKLSDLKPNVKLKIVTDCLDMESDLKFLRDFHCVILTDKKLQLQLRVNQFCRQQSPPIPFISTDVKGICGWIFVDVGKEISIDETEENDENLRGFVSNSTPGIVTILGNKSHNLENDDTVYIESVNSDNLEKEKIYKVQTISRNMFSTELNDYEGEVVISPVKKFKKVKYQSLLDQLYNPTILPLISNNSQVHLTHLAILAFYLFWEKENRLPNDENDNDLIFKLVEQINEEQFHSSIFVDYMFLKKLSSTWNKSLQPLSSLFGGLAAQETLKCLTGKFSTLHQWFNFECTSLVNLNSKSLSCLDEKVSIKLKDLNLLLVGCGAIGCEILKNCALLGIGTKKGQITVVDHDRIELSNLCTQHLYKIKHIGQMKSLIAAEAAKTINSELNIVSIQQQVSPQTENLFSDIFPEIDVIITAIDNMEGRRYLDSLSIKYTRPMFDSGMDGNKGHVQAMIPYESEHYSKHYDPPEEDIPYCTLKSFPSTIQHTTKWARDKFDNFFHFKPSAFNKFWQLNPDLSKTMSLLNKGHQFDYFVLVTKILQKRPRSILDCIFHARIMFEKYFNHKARQLLHTFPCDSKFNDGGLFWQFPKRAPTPVIFVPWNKLHINFIISCAKLLAIVHNIKEEIPENITNFLLTAQIGEFVPKNKRVETDENMTKSQSILSTCDDNPVECATQIKLHMDSSEKFPQDVLMCPVKFNKEDPLHLDFIESTSNLRATMYGITPADRFAINKIAGSIIPSIITTSSFVASLVTIELLKHISGSNRSEHNNYYINLALPLIVSSEPAKATSVNLRNGLSYTIWDRWEIKGNAKFTLQQFLDQIFTITSGLKVSLVVEGTKMVYVPYMPGHDKKRKHEMASILKTENCKQFYDLSVAFEDENGEDIMGPRVRYFVK